MGAVFKVLPSTVLDGDPVSLAINLAGAYHVLDEFPALLGVTEKT